MTELLHTVHASEWNYPLPAAEAAQNTAALENGKVLFLPRLAFTLSAEEKRFLSPQWSDGKAKNVSYDPAAHQVRHTAAQGDDRAALAAMMDRYANAARTLVPRTQTVRPARISASVKLRPCAISQSRARK